jgi:glycosyltransferase involved in cell wall biosynthesis
MNITHITTGHNSSDLRIYFKECRSLSKAGHKIKLIAPQGNPEIIEGIRIIPLRKAKGRYDRFTRIVFEACIKSLKTNADVYHFHDFELLPFGIFLKILGKRVIYDVHEDYSVIFRGSTSRQWVPLYIRPFLSKLILLLEIFGSKIFNGIVAATPAISKKFPPSKTVIINNYPINNEDISQLQHPYNKRQDYLVYAGAISDERGVFEMVNALDLLPVSIKAKMILIGEFTSQDMKEKVANLKGWKKVIYIGQVKHADVLTTLSNSKVGLLFLHPAPNHIESQPTKLYEYMLMGLPVIASDFPLWRAIINKHKAGLLVNPKKPLEISNAITWIFEHPQEAMEMGLRGKEAVLNEYNWENEGKKLISFYDSVYSKK